uniref:Uncharacterized protein n=1 Tax=Timema shepardi TaxID=629360 RepID=A0A7R9AWQ8_TIMSH|nr:unnamed protein product [Timema shepardi]
MYTRNEDVAQIEATCLVEPPNWHQACHRIVFARIHNANFGDIDASGGRKFNYRLHKSARSTSYFGGLGGGIYFQLMGANYSVDYGIGKFTSVWMPGHVEIGYGCPSLPWMEEIRCRNMFHHQSTECAQRSWGTQHAATRATDKTVLSEADQMLRCSRMAWVLAFITEHLQNCACAMCIACVTSRELHASCCWMVDITA